MVLPSFLAFNSPMTRPTLVIAGAGGVVGRHLVVAARERYAVTVLTRSVDGDEPAGTRPVAWQPKAAKEGNEDALNDLAEVLDGAYAVVNLAGASIDDGRMDEQHKKRVLESRVDSTNTLVAAFERTENPPPAWFNASAVGYYGTRGDEILTEESAPQNSFFLSKVSQAWEEAARQVKDKTRLMIGRLGLVLAKDAPAWEQFKLPIKLFVGGPLGDGQQWYAWIDADDLARAVLFLLENDTAQGVYNFTAPEPVQQITLTRRAAEKMGRPAFVPAPAFALQTILGGLADALLLPSARALPTRLEEAGFTFNRPTIEAEMDKLF